MRKFKELLPGFVVLIVMVLVGIGILNLIGRGLIKAWAGFVNLISVISTFDTVLIIALISGTVTILGLIVNSIISVVLKASEHHNKTKADLQGKMEKPYSGFISLIYDMMESTKSSKAMSEREILERMIAFSKEVTLYGSNKVVKRWARYRTSADRLAPKDNVIQLESILFTIREDLGIKKGKMKKGEILSLFINDVKEVLGGKGR